MNIINSVLVFVGLHFIQANVDCLNTSTNSFSTQEKKVINSIQDFGRKISYAQWAKNPNENVVFSPLSITTILNLLLLGTNGSTNFELKSALNYSNDFQENVIHESFQKILTSLQQPSKGFEISLNTRLFPQEGFVILNSYKNISKKFFFTEIQNLGFRENPSVATERINSWVLNSTKGKIGKVFSGLLRRDTVFIIGNVIYFNATWENKFNSRLTRNGIFNTGSENITIPMMTSDLRIPYFKDDTQRFEIISLPYEGKRYSMYILKPVDNSGMGNLLHLEKTLSSTYLYSLIEQMKTQRLIVSLPRMKLSQDLDLKRNLKYLGVNKIFSESLANFNRFTDKKELFVSNIFHKAILEVTEEGTSGATVTVSVISPTSLPERFSVNKPSLLFIRDNDNGLILFWAKILKPNPLTE